MEDPILLSRTELARPFINLVDVVHAVAVRLAEAEDRIESLNVHVDLIESRGGFGFSSAD